MRKLEGVAPEIRELFFSLIEEVEQNIEESVTKNEFNELKEIARELTEFQKRTEQTVNELAEAQKGTENRLNRLEDVVQELAEAQKRTEHRVNELAEAQKKTEERLSRLEDVVQELAEAQKKTEERLSRLEDVVQELTEAQKRTEEEVRKLAVGLGRVRKQVGGLSRSVAYALENEAYRNLPTFLKEKHGIEVVDRLVRFELNGEEINLFAKAKRDGEELALVGESVLRLDDKGKLRKIKRKADMVSEEYSLKVSPIVVTHFATSKVMEEAKKAGFLVVQSFEW
jgi:chromosome segregation ATPase